MVTHVLSTSQPLKDIPALVELQSKNQWVNWKWGERDGKPTKIPYNPVTREPAESNNPATWNSYETVQAAFDASQLNGRVIQGVGYMFDKYEVGIDLDHCVTDDGTIEGWAQEIIDRFNSYSEFSPSGTGVHIYVRGITPDARGTRRTLKGKNHPNAAIEIYCAGRYFTVTGNHVPGTPTSIENRTTDVLNFCNEIKQQRESERRVSETRERAEVVGECPTALWGDEKIIEVASRAKNGEKFRALWEGDFEEAGYGSQSEADQGLCVILAFYTWRDEEKMDRLFRKSGLMRGKWDRAARSGELYGEGTIRRACELCDEVYTPGYSLGPYGVSEKGAQKVSQAEQIVAWVLEAGVELFCSTDEQAFARIPIEGHIEVYPVRSRGFNDFIMNLYYDKLGGGVPGSQGAEDAKKSLEARASRNKIRQEVFMRIGRRDDKVYLDLCNAEWEVVEIGPDGWRIVKDAPVNFKRSKSMRPVEAPVRGGSIEELRPFVNGEQEEDWVLIKAHLLSGFHPTGPYPQLVISAQQGSGKSYTAKNMKRLYDPNVSNLRKGIREPDDFAVTVSNQYLPVFDNLSSIPQWLSDALCNLATGGGLSKREHYTNGEEFVIDVKRPAILTGIAEIATASDLLDRSLMIYPKKLDNYRDEKIMEEEYAEAQPRILGALLDAVSAALRGYRTAKVPGSIRMADFAKFVVSAEKELCIEPGKFVETYLENRSGVSEMVLDNSPVAKAVLLFMGSRNGDTFEASADTLKDSLELAYGLEDERDRKAAKWPTNAKTLSDAVFKIAPNLASHGYKVERLPRTSTGRKIRISRVDPKELEAVEAVQETTESENEPAPVEPTNKTEPYRVGVQLRVEEVVMVGRVVENAETSGDPFSPDFPDE